jgi:Mg-chelatase subunit ChlD
VQVAGTISLDRNFYLVIDGSGSMNDSACAGNFPNRIEAAKWAVTEFINRSVPPEVNLGLYSFDNNGARERAPLGKENRTQIIQEIKKISGGGNTPLNQALKVAVDALVTQSKRQLDYGKFYIVVATDGVATDEGRPDAGAGVLYAKQHGIPIISIGFCLKEDHALAKESVSYRDVRNPNELFLALQETQAESTYFDTTVFEKK